MLFDLMEDPEELKDVSSKPENQAIVASLMNKLEEMKQEVGDPLRNENPEESYKEFMTRYRPEHQYPSIKFKVD